MYNHEPKEYVCPLCQIAQGKPTEQGSQEDSIVLRDKDLTVFIAGKWIRSNPGHVIIIPNKHIENIYDMPNALGHKIFDMSKRICVALKEIYKCDGTSVRQHNEPAGNQDVWHYHLHVCPRYMNDNMYLNNNNKYWPPMEEKKPYADRLKEYFKNN